MKKLVLLLLLCFSFVTLAACDNDPDNVTRQKMALEDNVIMDNHIDSVTSIF